MAVIRVHVDNDPDLVDDLVVVLERIAMNVTPNVLVEVDDEG